LAVRLPCIFWLGYTPDSQRIGLVDESSSLF
jgi:hypothetical protein